MDTAKLLYRRLDSLFSALDPKKTQPQQLELFLEESFAQLKDDLRLKAGFLYSERRDDFALAKAVGDPGGRVAETLDPAAGPLQPVFRHRVYIFGDPHAEVAPYRLGLFPLAAAAGLVVGRRPHRHVFFFLLAEGWVMEELDFPEAALTVMLLFGGKGSPEMEPLAARLLETDPGWRVIAACGDNPGLVAKLSAIAGKAGGRLFPVGFTDRVAELMAASDLLVSKPGPGSLTEAFHQGVPVVVTRNRHTIPQERFNTRFVEERGLGLVVRHWTEIPEAVAAFARDPAARARVKAAIAAQPPNRAVYEALEIVEAEVNRGDPARMIR